MPAAVSGVAALGWGSLTRRFEAYAGAAGGGNADACRLRGGEVMLSADSDANGQVTAAEEAVSLRCWRSWSQI